MAFTTLAVTASMAGAGISAYAAHETGKFNRDMGRYQHRMSNYRAAQAETAGQEAAMQESLRRRQEASAGKVAFAGNGVLLDTAPTSAPNMWEQDQAAQLAYDRQVIMDNAEAQAWGLQAQGDMAGAQGSMAGRAGNMGAASALVGGVGSSTAIGLSGAAAMK